MTISDATLWAVAQNAIRHILEADEHCKKQRPPSALSAAVMAIEETGKLLFLKAPGRGDQNHLMKQAPFVAMLFLACDMGRWVDWQQILKEGLDPTTSLSDEQQSDVATHPEFEDFVRRLKAGDLTKKRERVNAFALAAHARCERDGTYTRWHPIFRLFHDLRMRATYVDVEVGAGVKPPPILRRSQLKLPSSSLWEASSCSVSLSRYACRADWMIISSRFLRKYRAERPLVPIVEAFQRDKAEREKQKLAADEGAAA